MMDPQQDNSLSPAKIELKWSPEEDEKLIRLREDRMTWKDISNLILGRSATSCRLRFQNHLEIKIDWDE